MFVRSFVAHVMIAAAHVPPPFIGQVAPAYGAEAGNEVSDAALLKRGSILWLKCRSCHALKDGAAHKTGPNLNGIFGAQAGSKAGFKYSAAIKGSRIVWDEDELSSFIESPASYVKGNRMAFIGLPKAEDRRALIRYLKENTQPPFSTGKLDVSVPQN